MNRSHRIVVALLCLTLGPRVLESRSAAWDVDQAFNPSLNGRVTHLLVQPDGKILVAGAFTEVNHEPLSRLARLHRDGTTDLEFRPNPDSGSLPPDVSVTALAVQPDGKILVGGVFGQIGGSSRSHLARLTASGGVDLDFAPAITNGSGVVAYIHSIVQQSDGQILIGGRFSSVNGVPRNSFARLNRDGMLDLGFDPKLGAEDEIAWVGLALQSDGRILAHARLTKPDESYRSVLVRLHPDGSLDASFQVAINHEVEALAVQPDGKLIIAGDFSEVGGVSRRGLARLQSDGTLDARFNPLGDFEHTYCVVPQGGGSVLVGGDYIAKDGIGGTPLDGGLVGLANDGSLINEFWPTVAIEGSGWPKGVWAIATESRASLLIGGVFTSVNGAPRPYIARLLGPTTPSDELDLSFDTRVNDRVGQLVPQADGKLLVRGFFTDIDGTAQHRVARVTADGEWDPGFGFTPLKAENGSLSEMIVLEGGMIILGGSFTNLGGFGGANLARLEPNGAVDPSFAPIVEGGAFPSVESILPEADSRMVIGGRFTQVNGEARNSIARLNADGTIDPSFDPVVAGDDELVWVFLMAKDSEGHSLATGRLLKTDGSYRHFLVRIDESGELDSGFRTEFNGDIEEMLVQSDGRIVIGGDFWTINGEPRLGLARLLPDGRLDRDFLPTGGPYESVTALATLIGGDLLVSVHDENNEAISRLFLLGTNGAVNLDFEVQMTGGVSDAIELDARILLGGWFESVNGVPQRYLARLVGSAPPSAVKARFETINYDPSGTVRLGLSGVPGSAAILQSSSNLVQWTRYSEIVFSDPYLQRTNPPSVNQQLYYRLVSP